MISLYDDKKHLLEQYSDTPKQLNFEGNIEHVFYSKNQTSKFGIWILCTTTKGEKYSFYHAYFKSKKDQKSIMHIVNNITKFPQHVNMELWKSPNNIWKISSIKVIDELL